MKLSEVASVRSGLVLSRKQSREPSDIQYPLLTLRAINPGGYIELSELDIFDAVERLGSEYLTHAGDVVIRLTAPYTAVLIEESTAGMVVSSNFVIIRADSRQVLPEYLYWLINTQQVKRTIYENTSSNMLGAIKAKYFSDFEIAPIPIQQQEFLADMNLLAIRESRLIRELAAEKEKFHALLIERAYNEMKREVI